MNCVPAGAVAETDCVAPAAMFATTSEVLGLLSVTVNGVCVAVTLTVAAPVEFVVNRK